MKYVNPLLFAMALLLSGIVSIAFAGETDPLFVNMTTNDPHRANMAITFSMNQQDRGHPITIFLNDKGVAVGSKSNAAKFAHQQKSLSELMRKGGVVIICPMCMKHYGIKKANLLPGIQVGNPELTGAALFKDNSKTMTW